MNDERKSGRASGGNVIAQSLHLSVARTEGVMIIEPSLADRHDFGMLRARDELLYAYVKLFMSVMGMRADRAVYIRKPLGNREHLRVPFEPR